MRPLRFRSRLLRRGPDHGGRAASPGRGVGGRHRRAGPPTPYPGRPPPDDGGTKARDEPPNRTPSELGAVALVGCHGHRQVGRRPRSWFGSRGLDGRGSRRAGVGRLHGRLPGDGHRDGQTWPGVRAEVPYHLIDIAEPGEDFSVRAFQDAAAPPMAGIADRGHRAVLVGGTGLYLRAVVDRLQFPGRFPASPPGLLAELTEAGSPGSAERRQHVARLHTRLAALDPPAAARMETANERRILRALEVTLGSGRPFSSFGPGLERYPDTPVTLIGIQPEAADLDRRIHERLTRQMEAGFLDEVARLAARPGGLSRTAAQALGYRELLTHLHDGSPYPRR